MIKNVYLYAKVTDNMQELDFALQRIMMQQRVQNIFISTEPNRSYYKLDKIKNAMGDDDVCVIASLASFGLNEADIAAGLEWFVKTPRMLIIANFSNSYRWGISQPLNQAILSTLQQALLGKNEGRTVIIPEYRKSNAGRKLISFPDNWEELYSKWEKKEITSKEFCEQSGLKKATFYNLVTEYREIKEANLNYFKRYKSV